MSFSQTVCQIELLFPLKLDCDEKQDANGESRFITLCKFNYDPCIPIGEEINVPEWKLGSYEGIEYSDKTYSFNGKVVGMKREIYPDIGEQGTFLIRYFIEAADRSLVIEMRNRIENNNLDEMNQRLGKI
jgi:hypothetical protein